MNYIKKIFKTTANEKAEIINGISVIEYDRLLQMPRYQKTNTVLWGKDLKISDSSTFLSSLKEIFNDEIYKFETTETCPLIIDCGANIGLATLYFLKLFPNSKIFSFEPDPNLYDCLVYNINSFQYDSERVLAFKKAVSSHNENCLFHFEGGHSGMIVNEKNKNVYEVKAICLKDFLSGFEKVDFLKIDIEGHETAVMPDIVGELHKVDKMFIEYHSFMNKKQELSELLAIIQQAGFRYYLKEAYNKKYPFIQREIFIEMDFLVNIFCYRI